MFFVRGNACSNFGFLFALRYQYVVIFYNFGQIPIGSSHYNEQKREEKRG